MKKTILLLVTVFTGVAAQAWPYRLDCKPLVSSKYRSLSIVYEASNTGIEIQSATLQADTKLVPLKIQNGFLVGREISSSQLPAQTVFSDSNILLFRADGDGFYAFELPMPMSQLEPQQSHYGILHPVTPVEMPIGLACLAKFN